MTAPNNAGGHIGESAGDFALRERPLEGLRVLELGALIAGPYATRVMAEFGAQVIKVERPGAGDPLRTWRYVDPRTETSLWWALQSIESGATVLDAAVGGTGGCPFAPQAARKVGNIATEDLVYLLHGMGYETGVDIEDLMEIAAWMEEQLEKELPGQVYKAGVFEPVTG
jgi:hypothetical protein